MTDLHFFNFLLEMFLINFGLEDAICDVLHELNVIELNEAVEYVGHNFFGGYCLKFILQVFFYTFYL